MSTENQGNNESMRESGIPGLQNDNEVKRGGDSYTTRESFKAFYQRAKYIGAHEGYGANIQDKNRLFYSTREPVGVWWIKRIAYDIWDNGFRVIDPDNPDDKGLDDETQRVLRDLHVKKALERETIFERRYGTAVLLCSYTGFGSTNSWEQPLFTLNEDGTYPDTLTGGTRLLQVAPYPWTAVSVAELDTDESSIRYGLPEYYTIHKGKTGGDSSVPSGSQETDKLKAHWTRVIHDAPRLDEHTYEGIPAIDAIFDDLVGGRNARWGAYESYYRHGTGFPVIKTKGTDKQNQDWIDNGGLNDYLNVRGYFVCHVDEDFSFEGAKGKVLDPNKYFDMYFTFIAAATGVAKNTIQGVSVGRATGSESDERQYYKSISLHQNQKEPVLRELLDRLMMTGQIQSVPDYIVEWVDPFEVNPQDKAAIEFMDARTTNLMTFMTINEVRAKYGLPPHPDGDVLMMQPGQMVPEGSEPAPNQEEPENVETEPEPGEPNNATLLDKTLQM